MMDRYLRIFLGLLVIVSLFLLEHDALAQAPVPKLADYFGFLPLELYKLDTRIGNLQLADLDGDKIDDIIVSNNGRSRIDLLLTTKKPADDKACAAVPQRPERARVRSAVEALEHYRQQGGHQHRYGRLQRRRQVRPGFLRYACRADDPLQRRQGGVYRIEEDSVRRSAAETECGCGGRS